MRDIKCDMSLCCKEWRGHFLLGDGREEVAELCGTCADSGGVSLAHGKQRPQQATAGGCQQGHAAPGVGGPVPHGRD